YAAPGASSSNTARAGHGQTLSYDCVDEPGARARCRSRPRPPQADIDLDRIVAERRRMNTFDDNRRAHAERLEDFTHGPEVRLFGVADGPGVDRPDTGGPAPDRPCAEPRRPGADGPGTERPRPGADRPGAEPQRPGTGPLRRKLDRFPFVPEDPARLAQDCYEAFSIQVAGLVRRLSAIGGGQPGGTCPVLGVSGGLDSTHALLVCAR